MDWLHYVEMGFILFIIMYLVITYHSSNEGYLTRSQLTTNQRLEKLEAETWYKADQPQTYYSIGSAFRDEDWEKKLHENDVPITDVVKAIVKHLGMEILKSPERTTKTPMEVKIVEKPKATGTVLSADGTGATWVAPTQPKPKRKYTKRKTK